MLTSTNIIKYIEGRLGFRFTDIEMSHDEIIETIRRDTLYVFSKYFPYQERIKIDSVNDLVDGYKNRYYLRTENEIINVNRIVGIGTYGADAIGAYIHPAAMMNLMGDPISYQMSADILSLGHNPITFVYYPPNQIEIAPNYVMSNNYRVILNVVHPSHFGTIPTNLQREFLDLAYYDIAANLYAMRKRFNNMQTSFGALELNLDDLQDAASRREELVQRMESSSLRYGKRKKVIIA